MIDVVEMLFQNKEGQIACVRQFVKKAVKANDGYELGCIVDMGYTFCGIDRDTGTHFCRADDFSECERKLISMEQWIRERRTEPDYQKQVERLKRYL